MARALLLDANLAVLFIVGLTNPSYIAKHKRLQTFAAKDFEVVSELISISRELVLCPHVMTETSNLLRYVAEPIRTELSGTFRTLVHRVREEPLPSALAADHRHFVRLGLTDAVLLTLAEQDAALLTVDLDLYLAALDGGLEAMNYNHLREAIL